MSDDNISVKTLAVTLDRDDLVRLFSGRRVGIPVDDNTAVIVRLDLDGGRLDPPEAREFLPARKRPEWRHE